MTLIAARAVADTVLYEGYLLYPYRSTSPKNQVRWQFGMLGPPGAAEAGSGEEPALRTECLLEPAADKDLTVDVYIRFLHVQDRAVQRSVDETGSTFAPVDALQVGSTDWISWHEAVAREVVFADLTITSLSDGLTLPVTVPAGREVELLGDDPPVGRLVRRTWALDAQLELIAASVDGPHGLLRLQATLRNRTRWQPAMGGAANPRDIAARYSFVGTHLLLHVRGGTFVSLADPPAWAASAAAGCHHERCWPVLMGNPRRPDIVLVSPIILDDHPVVAPESPGDLFDATEIDEILTLRVMTLTDEEKQAARGTDPRAAAIIDRCDTLPPEVMERLHGGRRDAAEPVVPWWDPGVDASVSPDTDAVVVDGVSVAKGSRVRLRPSRRADAQDLFLAERTAVVTAVYADVDGGSHVAVLLEDDPASDLHDWYGRYYYFGPEELEPLDRRTAGNESRR